jgi:hypothetical protein
VELAAGAEPELLPELAGVAVDELAGVPAWDELPGSAVPVVVPCEPDGVALVEPLEEGVEPFAGVGFVG